MNKEYFLNVTIEQDISEYIDTLDKNKLLIFSPTSIRKIKISNDKIQMENWHSITKNKQKIDKYIESIDSRIDEIITFGGGSVIDIGKYIAYKLNIKCTCIPSMLSTNSYATNKVAIIKNEKKITLNAKMPDKIIIDNMVLKLSEKENLYGLADVLSIYTALYDWKIANEDINEKIDENIYKEAEKLLKEVINFINTNTFSKITENNLKLYEFIGRAGYITNLYGTGRPESGSEHILAKEIESKINLPHGISVSIGIIIMSIIQNQYNEDIAKAIMKLKILDKGKEHDLNMKIIVESLKNIKKREDRYTIINRNDKISNINEVIQKFEKIIRENKVDLK